MAPVVEHEAPPLAALALVTLVAANIATAATLVTERRFKIFAIKKRQDFRGSRDSGHPVSCFVLHGAHVRATCHVLNLFQNRGMAENDRP
ncbi:hypothetical protein [Streptomyces sp. NPDC086519]|uniref:hypothetical protein n=1 Tax=Streptomyces sp. NPDC086519 TaxID=3154863 RepID=UPI003416261F